MSTDSGREPINVGCIGCGMRGLILLRSFMQDPTVRIGAVCNVFEPNLQAGCAVAPGSKAYRRYTELLEDKDIRAVIIATPEHWHHRMLLDALDAGTDVYIEKPLCHTPEEGVELVEAARASRSIIQVGMQRRSYDLYLKARDLRAAGTLGTVRVSRSWWVNNNLHDPHPGDLEGALDWAQWQGPAEPHPYDPNRFRFWRNYKAYSGGIVADQGAHVFDGIHLITGVGFPTAATAVSGPVHDTRFETPETVSVTAEYSGNFMGIFTINYAGMRYPMRIDQLNQFDGDEARLDIGRESMAVYRRDDPDTPSLAAQGSFPAATDAHVRHFLECVRTRNTPTATVESAFQAALVIQLANI